MLHPRPRRGAVLPWVTVCLMVLVGAAAFALDGGLLLNERRRAQAVADAAALAAAADLFDNYRANGGQDPSGTAAQSARTTAAANGYPNDQVTTFVTVNLPPANYQGGPKAGTPLPAGYAEVIVEKRVKRAFSAIWGSGDLPVRARAVARGTWAAADAGILTLNRTAVDSFLSTANGNITVTGGASIIINSSNSLAGDAQGSGVITAASPGKINITGNYGGAAKWSPAPNTGVPPTPDPLRFLPAVDPSTLPLRTVSSGASILYPGRYSGSVQLQGGATITLAGEGALNADGTVIQPGQAIYYFDGGPVQINNDTNVTSSGGVMIYYNPSSPSNGFTLGANGNLSVTPLTAGPYAGMSFFMARGAAASLTLSGNGSANSFTGTVYAPSGFVDVSGNGSLGFSQLICDTLKVEGNGGLNQNSAGPKVKVRRIQLVE